MRSLPDYGVMLKVEERVAEMEERARIGKDPGSLGKGRKGHGCGKVFELHRRSSRVRRLAPQGFSTIRGGSWIGHEARIRLLISTIRTRRKRPAYQPMVYGIYARNPRPGLSLPNVVTGEKNSRAIQTERSRDRAQGQNINKIMRGAPEGSGGVPASGGSPQGDPQSA
jgi:hypothetical protein